MGHRQGATCSRPPHRCRTGRRARRWPGPGVYRPPSALPSSRRRSSSGAAGAAASGRAQRRWAARAPRRRSFTITWFAGIAALSTLPFVVAPMALVISRCRWCKMVAGLVALLGVVVTASGFRVAAPRWVAVTPLGASPFEGGSGGVAMELQSPFDCDSVANDLRALVVRWSGDDDHGHMEKFWCDNTEPGPGIHDFRRRRLGRNRPSSGVLRVSARCGIINPEAIH